jgi:hypothetical protein
MQPLCASSSVRRKSLVSRAPSTAAWAYDANVVGAASARAMIARTARLAKLTARVAWLSIARATGRARGRRRDAQVAVATATRSAHVARAARLSAGPARPAQAVGAREIPRGATATAAAGLPGTAARHAAPVAARERRTAAAVPAPEPATAAWLAGPAACHTIAVVARGSTRSAELTTATGIAAWLSRAAARAAAAVRARAAVRNVRARRATGDADVADATAAGAARIRLAARLARATARRAHVGSAPASRTADRAGTAHASAARLTGTAALRTRATLACPACEARRPVGAANRADRPARRRAVSQRSLPTWAAWTTVNAAPLRAAPVRASARQNKDERRS